MTLRALLLVQLLGALGAHAQTGVLVGTVSDGATGRPVSNVVVTATSPSLQGELLVATDTEGRYRMLPLPVGHYTLKFEHEDFETLGHSDLRLRAGRTLRLNVSLPLRRSLSPAPPTIGSDNSSSEVSIAQGFVRSCGVERRSAPSPALRPFESFAHLAPRSSNLLYAVSIGRDSPEVAFVIDGVAELAPEWTHDYPPIVRPTGQAHRLHIYPEEVP